MWLGYNYMRTSTGGSKLCSISQEFIPSLNKYAKVMLLEHILNKWRIDQKKYKLDQYLSKTRISKHLYPCPLSFQPKQTAAVCPRDLAEANHICFPPGYYLDQLRHLQGK